MIDEDGVKDEMIDFDSIITDILRTQNSSTRNIGFLDTFKVCV